MVHLAMVKCIISAALRWREHEALLSPWVRLGLVYLVRVLLGLGLVGLVPWPSPGVTLGRRAPTGKLPWPR